MTTMRMRESLNAAMREEIMALYQEVYAGERG